MDATVDITIRGSHFVPPVRDVEWDDAEMGPQRASFTLLDPRVGEQLAEDCDVVISDPRSGETLWTGWVHGEGISDNGDGTWDVECHGTALRCYNRRLSLPYVVRDLDSWSRESLKYRSTTNVDTQVTTRPMDPPLDTVLIQLPEGKGAYPGLTMGRMMYTGHQGSDMWIGAYRGYRDCGAGFQYPTEWRYRLVVGDEFYGNVPIESSVAETTSTLFERAAGGTGWRLPPTSSAANEDWNVLTLTMAWSGPAPGRTGYTNASQQSWVGTDRISVAGQRLTRYGANAYMGPLAEAALYVTASEVVEDLIGRHPEIIDPTDCQVAATTFNIAQLDYRDGITMGDAFDDMMLIHRGHMWRVSLARPDGRFSLRWGERPTAPRYVLPDDGTVVDLPGSSAPLANRVVVEWLDWRSRPRQATYAASTADYPDTAEMRTPVYAETIDLGAEMEPSETVVSAETAKRVGTQVLDEVARKRRSGTATVTRPVLDLIEQTLVTPASIQAGERVALESTGEQFHASAVRHPDLHTAEITLNSPRRSVDEVVAALGRRRRR